MLKVNRQYSQQLSINDDGTPIPISVLLDELLEEIFSHLSAADQLNCRFVCRLWNHVLCSCPRLLRKNVGMRLKLERRNNPDLWSPKTFQKQENLKEHPIISKLKANSAIQVKSLIIMCNIFYGGDDALKSEDVVNFFIQHGINSSVETLDFRFLKEPDVMQKFYDILLCLKSLKKLIVQVGTIWDEDGSEEQAEFVFEKKWNDVTFPSIKYIDIEPKHCQLYYIWTPVVFTTLTKFFERMPNIKQIQGVIPYNKEFYHRFGHLMILDPIFIDDTTFEIIKSKDFKLPMVSILREDDMMAYDLTNYWQRLHTFHPELEEIHFSTEDPIPFSNDYSKVTKLKLSLCNFERSGQTLAIILKHFPNLKTLEVDEEVIGSCFFGHEIPHLPKLESVSLHEFNLFAKDFKWNCLECINAMTKAFSNVNYLELHECNINILTAISANMKKIKKLEFHLESEIADNLFTEWPEIKSLEWLGFTLLVVPVTTRSLEYLMQQCPRLLDIHFQFGVIIKN